MTPSNVPILTEELTDLLARYNLKAVPLEETKPEYYELSIRTPTNINLSDLESEILTHADSSGLYEINLIDGFLEKNHKDLVVKKGLIRRNYTANEIVAKDYTIIVKATSTAVKNLRQEIRSGNSEVRKAEQVNEATISFSTYQFEWASNAMNFLKSVEDYFDNESLKNQNYLDGTCAIFTVTGNIDKILYLKDQIKGNFLGGAYNPKYTKISFKKS